MDRHADVPALPRSFLAWLPFLWSRVLFPGSAAPERGSHRGVALAGVLLLPAVLLYPRLDFHLLEPDESRYAEIPREMLERRDWIVPHLHGEPYLDKPPLLYWLVGVSYEAFGIHVW